MGSPLSCILYWVCTVDCGAFIVYIFFPKEKDMKNGQEIILVYICQHNSQNKTQKIVQ